MEKEVIDSIDSGLVSEMNYPRRFSIFMRAVAVQLGRGVIGALVSDARKEELLSERQAVMDSEQMPMPEQEDL